ncbi:coiled-coil domain-containing protein 17-like isoform X1 [Astyanax mexicanus]|uniref:Coiled-coil domain-containing protein 17-like n=1 Tax=Astyanax mexicanus TaxID=7994 RepID=A0A8B9RI26_ASTMX|nr:coiled-coil domain-containing protein 17-like isoform X1 [Astyanax mexicanus]
MDSLICSRCNMTFRSSNFLAKHREKFCIGGVGQNEESDFHQNLNERIRELRRIRQQDRPNARAQLSQQNIHTPAQNHMQKPSSEPTAGRSEDQLLQIQPKMDKQKMVRSADSKHLNQHREEMDLQELPAQNRKVALLEEMLFELQEQEKRNTSLLESLMNHLQHVPREPRSFTSKESPHLHIPETSERVAQTYLPVYDGGALSAEISTLRLSYLQSGGKDSQILAQLQDLLDEALKVEKQPGKSAQPRPCQTERTKQRPKPRDRRRDFSRELISTECENQRLEEEIMRLQLRRRRPAVSRTTPPAHCRPREQEMRSMKMDIDLLKHEIEINHLKRQIRSRKEEPALVTFPPLEEPGSQTPPFIRYPVDEGLGPAPYDPMAGFVVFYDFLLGLCPSYRVCRLMVGLYTGDQCLGSPFVLPPVYCELSSFSSFPPWYSQGQKAAIATKQAVPEVQPAPSMCLVIQVQASGGYDIYGQEVTSLAPRGWVKLNIFDHHHRIISGRWKIPVRILPAKPSMTTAEVNSVPQLDNAELFLRIVNARDAEIQSTVPISTHTAGIYRYPPVTSPRQRFSRQVSHEAARRTSAVPSAQVYIPAFTQSLEPPGPT